jgi:hypothetical protein
MIPTILYAKSKVASLNFKLMTPKVELCTALLLTKLYKIFLSILPVTFNDNYFWSAFSVTINWINIKPRKLIKFIDYSI